MRLLQLDPNGDEASVLDFHPMVTVVKGLSPSGREAVVRAIRALPLGDDPGCSGLVEAHGVLMDLSPRTLTMLGLHSEAQVIVGPSDLPGGPAPAAAAPSAVEVEDFIADTPEGVYPDLDAARTDVAGATEARSLLQVAADRSREAHLEAIALRRALEAEEQAAGAAAARPALHLVSEEPADDEPGDSPESDLAALVRERGELEALSEGLMAQVARTEKGLEELAGLDVRPIKVLLDALSNPAPVEYVPSERANELADEFARLQGEVGALEEGLVAKGMDTPTAMERLDQASIELRAAERAMRPPEFTDLDRGELEAAHDEVLAAESKSRGRAGKKRLDEAMAVEQQILDRMGFPTWSSYVMGAGLMGIDPAAEQNLERARFEMEAAQAHWAEVTTMIEADPVHRELLDRLEAVYLEAFDLLGGEEPDDVESALRNVQEAKREISIEELADALAYQLELLGMPLEGSPSVDHVVIVAEAFLEEASAVTLRIEELERDLAEATEATMHTDARLTELAMLEAAASERTGFVPVVEVEPSEAEIADVGDALDDEALADLRQRLEVAIEDEQEYGELVDARDELLSTAIQIHSVAVSRLRKLAAVLLSGGPTAATSDEPADEPAGEPMSVEGVEFFLVTRLAELRSLSYAGSVPLLLDDALTPFDPVDARRILTKLAHLSASVQIVYLSDDDGVRAWADDAGFAQAAVVMAPAAFA